jgi:ABC-type oligopeptide transport system substrate-binding subunit
MTKTKHKLLILMLAVLATASLAVSGCTKSESTTSSDGKKYTCEMHPEVVQDKPGECPKCHMKLVEKK